MREQPNVTDCASVSRLQWGDAARGIGIQLVVVGHVVAGLVGAGLADLWKDGLLAVIKVIYSFHMAVFFLLSGAFARSLSAAPDRHYLAGKTRSLLYPYLVWGVLQISLQVLMDDVTNKSTTWSDLIKLAYDPPMQFWFNYVLFISFVLYVLVGRGAGVWGFVIATFAISFALALAGIEDYWLPELRDNLPLFALGVVAGSVKGCVKNVSNWKLLCVIVCGYGLTISLHWLLSPGYLYTIFTSLAGASATFALAEVLVRGRKSRWFEFVGRMSLEIYLAHVIAYAGVRIALLSVFGIHSFPVHLVLGTVAGVAGPILLALAANGVGFGFLFRWPRTAPLTPAAR
ncbi:acyltransferase family protein [Gemmata massiliana]|nr:acyltransferase family protein [Gemmata massiliana]